MLKHRSHVRIAKVMDEEKYFIIEEYISIDGPRMRVSGSSASLEGAQKRIAHLKNEENKK